MPEDAVDGAPASSPRRGSRTHQRTSSLSSLFSGRTSRDSNGDRAGVVSPLKQVNSEPIATQPKVVSLYDCLFDGSVKQPGYWVEFFLLKVNPGELRRVLAADPGNFVSESGQNAVHTLVRASVANLATSLPKDIVINAIEVLTIVVSVTLNLTSTPAAAAAGSTASSSSSLASPSASFSVIQALAGLENASAVFDELTARVLALLTCKDRSVVAKAVTFLLETGSRVWATQLSALFSTKNFFAALLVVIDENLDDDTARRALTAIGVLAAVNIFGDDGALLYKQRLNDYVDEAVMAKILVLAQRELVHAPPRQENVLKWVSSWFESPAPAPPAAAASQSCPLLALFLFVVHNSVFSSQLAASPAFAALIVSSARKENFALSRREQPWQTSRTWLALLIMRTVVDRDFALVTDVAAKTVIALSRSQLVPDDSRRVPLAGILDFAVLVLRYAKITANRDLELAAEAADLVYQTCAQIAATRTILEYNWTQLWKTLLVAAPLSQVLATRLLETLVGMSLRRDLLEEEDWHALMLAVCNSKTTLNKICERFPALKRERAVLAANSMHAQYELNKERPDFAVIMKQGAIAGGALIGERLRPFGMKSVKWAVKEQTMYYDVPGAKSE